MDFLERLNEAMEYIESNLSDEIDYKELARLVGCSEYHLSRTFPFIAGQGLGQYIRRKRMSRAAMDLMKPGADLLEIAVTYGYSSADSFSRALREIHEAAHWGHIYSEWFPQSDYELREGPELLWNEGPDTSIPDFRSEIWIPVRAK